MKPYPNEELDRMSKREIIRLYKRTVEQFNDAVPVVHGKWITEECLPGVAVCSICGHEIRGIGCQYTKYCDECGARMDAE